MRDAEERRAASITQGVQGLASTAGQVGQSLNLYQKSEGAKAYDKLIKQGLAAGKTQEQIQNIVAAQGGPLAGMGYSKTSVDANGKPIVGFQTPIQFQDALSQDAKMVNELLKLNLFSPKPIPTTEVWACLPPSHHKQVEHHSIPTYRELGITEDLH
jgi:hypothetical protein